MEGGLELFASLFLLCDVGYRMSSKKQYHRSQSSDIDRLLRSLEVERPANGMSSSDEEVDFTEKLRRKKKSKDVPLPRHARSQSMSLDQSDSAKDWKLKKFSDEVIFVDMLDSSHLSEENSFVLGDSDVSPSGSTTQFNASSIRGRWSRRRTMSFDTIALNEKPAENTSSNIKERIGRLFGHSNTNNANAWEWKKPPDEDSILPERAALYLALIGWLTFAVCYAVSFASASLDSFIRLHDFSLLLLFRCLCAAMAYLIPANVSEYAMGSGVPELKCVVNGSFLPKSLAPSTILARATGLAFSLSSGMHRKRERTLIQEEVPSPEERYRSGRGTKTDCRTTVLNTLLLNSTQDSRSVDLDLL